MVAVDFERLTETLASGTALSAVQLRAVSESRDLIGLGMLAADVRARMHGTRGTFARVEMLDTAAIAGGAAIDIPADAGEVRLTGAPASIEHAVAAVRAARGASSMPLSGWTLEELAALERPLADVLAAVSAAGLTAVAAARIDRTDLDQMRAVADARLAVQSVTLGTPVDGEALLDQLEQLRAWQAATGVVRACAPLPVEVSVEQPTTGYDDMRHVAIARLVLDNVPHVQAHWLRMGAKLSQACLLFGADDIDAVPARDDMPHGPRRAIVEEVRRNLLAASLEPVERDGAFAARESRA